jgi:hypothetical protein
VFPDVSKEHTAFIFKGQEFQEHLDLLALDESSTLLRNVGTGIYSTVRALRLYVICAGNLEVNVSFIDSTVAAAVFCFCRMCNEPYAPVRTYRETRKLVES